MINGGGTRAQRTSSPSPPRAAFYALFRRVGVPPNACDLQRRRSRSGGGFAVRELDPGATSAVARHAPRARARPITYQPKVEGDRARDQGSHLGMVRGVMPAPPGDTLLGLRDRSRTKTWTRRATTPSRSGARTSRCPSRADLDLLEPRPRRPCRHPHVAVFLGRVRQSHVRGRHRRTAERQRVRLLLLHARSTGVRLLSGEPG